MKPEPNVYTDAVAFLTRPAWTTVVYWLLLIISILVATQVHRNAPDDQRGLRPLGIWVMRVAMGTMWWQGSLWKIPPNFDGLLYWMKQIVMHSTIPLQAAVFDEVMIPHIGFFGWVVYLTEAFIGASLILGLLTRWFSLLGLLMALNLWLGLYSAPGEWPWTYGFLIIIQVLFVIDPPGRCLGLDWRRP
ncbi:MAG TPA: DoxX family protein [Rhodopila sp.]